MIVMLVREVMSRDVLTVAPDATLADARQVLDQHRIRHLPVVDRGRLVGIVSDRDLRSATLMDERTAVGRIMTATPITVGPDTRIEDAARLLIDRKIGGLPVVAGTALIGIVTGDDLLRALVAVIEAATLERISVEFAGGRDA
jgi:acetoin utilization protein AcuB